MSQLGFTFYPKDWWTSDTFFILNPFERYIYLELIFMMYDNDGFVSNNKALVEGRLRTTIKDEVWRKITDLLVKDGDKLTHDNVNKRLRRAKANRENGQKGGAPQGNLNALKQPKQPTETTQNNPPLEREREIERESETESEEEIITPADAEAPASNSSFAVKAKYFIDNFNTIKGGDGKPCQYQLTTTVKDKLKARIRDGYTSKQIFAALRKAMSEQHHKDNGLKWITPEFILRSDKLEAYLHADDAIKTGIPLTKAQKRRLQA